MRLLTPKNLTRLAAVFGAVAITVSTSIQPSMAAPASPNAAVPVPAKTITTQSVGAQMFMWPWVSLKTECTKTLGPEGVDWIMVSPPQEDISGSQWWVHYQPVSYKIDSQLGNRQQFADMVSACNAAGVQVIVDAVINHMTNSHDPAFAGTKYSKYIYPGLYDYNDFHNGLALNDPNYCDGQIVNYDDPFDTTHCELGGLADLATEKPNVRAAIAGYLNDLESLGVAGFRVDAAKHFGITDLTAVYNMLNPVNGKPPYFLSETIGNPATNLPFTKIGDVFAWDYPDQMVNMFQGGMTGLGRATDLRGTSIGEPNVTVTMVSNHDTEHHGPSSLSYLSGKTFELANEFLLADPLGKPMLYTGYGIDLSTSLDDGPLANGSTGYYLPATCPKAPSATAKVSVGKFVCLQRWTSIKGMIQWHHEVGTAPMTNALWANKVLSFNRGSGFFAVNNTPATIKETIATGLPKGTYCDVISGGAKAIAKGKCLGTTVVVAANGSAKVAITAKTGLALDATNRLK